MPALVLCWEADVSKPGHLRLAGPGTLPKRHTVEPVLAEKPGYYWHPGGRHNTALCGHQGVLYDDLQVLDTARLAKSCPGCVQVAAETPGCTGLCPMPVHVAIRRETKKTVARRVVVQRINRRLRPTGQQLRVSANKWDKAIMGSYYIKRPGGLCETQINLPELVARLGVLRSYEELGDT